MQTQAQYLEKHGPKDKREDRNRFDFDQEQFKDFLRIMRSRPNDEPDRLTLEVDFFSARGGWTGAEDVEQWEAEMVVLSDAATREGFREAYRLGRALLGGRHVVLEHEGLTILGLKKVAEGLQ